MIHLRPYQVDAVERLRDLYRFGKRRVCLVAPTGSGKTVIAGHLVSSATTKDRKVLYVAHRRELLDQPLALLEGCGLRCGRIQAGHEPDPSATIQVASIQTLVNRELPEADLVIIDECHRAVTKSYDILAEYPNQIGLTATPWRLDGRGLGDRYDSLLEVSNMAELVRDGWLISPTIYAPSAPSETPKASGADYTLAECARVMDHSKLVGSIVEHWRRITPGQTTVCFTSGIPHSRHVVERFRAADIAAEHVDGTTPADERAGILERLASGATQIVSNVDIITEGYDLPRLSCAIMARPTMSLTKYLQMVGRIMRPVNGKSTCTLLDHAGCSVRHGYPTEARTWSLSGRENRRERAAVRVCSYCFCVNKVTATICEHCGEVFPVQSRPRKPLHESDGELVRSAQQRWRAVTPHTRHTRLRDWYRMCHERGYKIGWAHLRFKHVFGHWPSEAERAAARSE